MSKVRVYGGKQGVFVLCLDRFAGERILQQRRLTFLSDARLASFTSGKRRLLRATTREEAS